MLVCKFGGASVNSAEGVKKLATIVQESDNNLVIVVSAMGKMTNAFEKLVQLYFNNAEDINLQLDLIYNFHINICNNLFEGNNLKTILHTCQKIYIELNNLLTEVVSSNFDFEYDKIVPYGELFSTSIVSTYLNSIGLNNTWIDIRDLLKTNNQYREAKVDLLKSEELVRKQFVFDGFKKIYLTQGFIASDSDAHSTTLGREGSDYTAALIANFLNAKNLIEWKDVPGIMNADPNWYNNAEKILEMNYKEAIELAFYGAKVIHPKTIKPLQNKNINMEVRSFNDTEEQGTIISNKEVYINKPLYILKIDQILISISNPDFSFILEHSLSEIFSIFAKHNVKVNLMQNSAVSFTVCCDFMKGRTEFLLDDLKNHYKVLYNYNVSLLTIRHYIHMNDSDILANREILVEQRSRNTAQYVIKENPVINK